MSDPTISGQVLRHILHCVELAGGAIEPLLAGLVSREALDDPECRIRLADFLRVFETAATHVGNPHFGLHAGRLAGADYLGAVGFLFLSAPTLREGFTGFTRYLATLQQAAGNLFTEDAHWATYAYTILDQSLGNRRQDAEYSLGAAYTLARNYAGGELALEEVRFEHELVGELRRYEAYFGCPVRFAQERNAFSFDRRLLDLRGRSLSPALHPIIEDHLRRKSGEKAMGFGQQLRSMLDEAPLDALPSASRLAQHFAISVPTLGRRLRAEGLSLRDLLLAQRMTAAARLLRQSRRPIGDIALAVGYAESASFIRAFEKHHGLSPQRYRMIETINS